MNTNKTMPYDAGEIREIKQIIEVATTLRMSWFRGHPEEYGNLTPNIFRPKYITKNVLEPHTEYSVIEYFKRVAPALTQNIPNQDDHFDWLFLMQHHGAPTRLLDWTENALVALYFAVRNFSDDNGKNGELWAIYPYFLNQKGYEFNGIATQSNKILQYLAKEPYLAINPASGGQKEQEKLAKEVELNKVPQYPLALYPTMKFPRMVNQLSTFTIHPTPSILRQKNTIHDLLGDNKKYLVRYIIPQGSKLELINKLETLGISRRTLFPDLDGLSQTIIEKLNHTPFEYNPQDPPEF